MRIYLASLSFKRVFKVLFRVEPTHITVFHDLSSSTFNSFKKTHCTLGTNSESHTHTFLHPQSFFLTQVSAEKDAFCTWKRLVTAFCLQEGKGGMINVNPYPIPFVYSCKGEAFRKRFLKIQFHPEARKKHRIFLRVKGMIELSQQEKEIAKSAEFVPRKIQVSNGLN